LLSQENLFNKEGLYIPLMNIHREEIALRKDILYLFQLFDISVDDLLFLDDVSLNRLFEEKRLRLNLVDHNVLNPTQEHLSDAIERIVDHHFDENKYYPIITDENKLVAAVGSNATLVAEKIFASHQVIMSTELATILLAPILIDTSHLKSLEKTTDRDVLAAEQLQEVAFFLPQDFYVKLLDAKNDISGLTPTMLLSKDFKEYIDGHILYGISSLPPAVQWDLEDLELFGENIQKYAYERNLNFLILLLHSHDSHTRKIVVYSPSIDLLRVLDEYVQADENLKKILIPGPFSETFRACFYRTEKPIARKELQPLFNFSSINNY
jgi:exopolyphosphatase